MHQSSGVDLVALPGFTIITSCLLGEASLDFPLHCPDLRLGPLHLLLMQHLKTETLTSRNAGGETKYLMQSSIKATKAFISALQCGPSGPCDCAELSTFTLSNTSQQSSSITKNRSDHSLRHRLCFSNMPASLCLSAIAKH